MAAPSVVDRLAAQPRLAAVPREQLEWLAAHGELRRFDAGEVMFSHKQPPPGLYVVLSGRVSIRAERDGVARVVNEVMAGGISGRLPYSRMSNAAGKLAPGAIPGFSMAEERVEIFLVTGADVRDLTRECYEFTALCVHEMVDRTRLFKSDDLQREKMASLGRLAAGLAHELNNPSSAVARSAKEMDACRLNLALASRELGAAGLAEPQWAALSTLETTAARVPDDRHSPLARSDREDAIEQWLDDHGLDPGLAEGLSAGAITAADLDAVAAALSGPQLPVALRYVASSITAGRLTAEIEHAATRIHSLVAAIKKHTHMDRAPVPEPITLQESLADTLTLIGSKARGRSIVLTLNVEDGLPPVRGVVGELNEVWLNLVDNAIDAAPDRGHVSVTARGERGDVVVSVVDDGAGISEIDQGRIFEPFFTTKPVGRGTGLGLDVVQRVVRSHGGVIEVSSRPGRTEFRVSLPAATPTPDASVEPKSGSERS